MMGHALGHQNKLYYDIRLEDYVPKKHLLRGIDRHLDLSDLRQYLTPFYSHTGRPSVDPERIRPFWTCHGAVPGPW